MTGLRDGDDSSPSVGRHHHKMVAKRYSRFKMKATRFLSPKTLGGSVKFSVVSSAEVVVERPLITERTREIELEKIARRNDRIFG